MALTSWTALSTLTKSKVQNFLLFCKGVGTNEIYAIETDPTTGGLPVVGLGTAGSQTGGLITIQGDPSGTPIPISGNITASSASVGPTGSGVPADADYQGLNNGGTLIGAVGDSAGRTIIAGAGVAGTPAGGVVSIQGVTSGTVVPVSVSNFPATQPVSGTVAATQSGTWNIAALTSITNPIAATQSGTWNIGTLTSITNALPAGTNALGTVAPTTTTAAFQAEGSLAFGSITGTYQTIFTPAAATKILQMRNNTNAAISVSFDAGTTLNYVMDPGDAVSVDLATNFLLMSTTAIQIKETSSAPTSGSFRVNGCH